MVIQNHNSQEHKLHDRCARIAVVGLGFAGLPTAVELARAGLGVIGHDLDKHKVALIHGARALLVGVTYKPDTADDRELAALRVYEEAVSSGAVVSYHDPLVEGIDIRDGTVASAALTAQAIRAVDAIVLLTPHSTRDYDLNFKEASLVVDTHGGLSPRSGANVFNVWTPQSPAGPRSDDNPELRSAA